MTKSRTATGEAYGVLLAPTATEIKAYRERLGLSAAQFAVELGGHTRQHIKNLEGANSAAYVSAKFLREWAALRERMGEGVPVVRVQAWARHKLPAGVEIEGRARRCKGCGKPVVFGDRRQIVHKAAYCQRLWARKRDGYGARRKDKRRRRGEV